MLQQLRKVPLEHLRSSDVLVHQGVSTVLTPLPSAQFSAPSRFSCLPASHVLLR